MAGTPHPVLAVDERFRGYLSPNAWTLCVGAGISKGIAPEWYDLTFEVVRESFGNGIKESDFSELVKDSGWTLDSWIQAAANAHLLKGGLPEEFKDLIESKLYAKIRDKAKGMGIERHLTKVLNYPKNEPKDRVIEVCNLIESAFPNSSLVQIAETLIQAAKSGHGPKAVLTFNADTFLETFIDLRLRRDHYLGPGPHGHPNYSYVQVTRPANASGSKIPIIHCHGCVAPRWSSVKNPRDSRDRLVFLEQEYLAMAESGAAWAETVFLYHAQSTKLVFAGLSMSDTNIRRWMSAMNLERAKDRHIFEYADRPNPDHIWIRPRPKEEIACELLLSSLHHLGIRPAWISSWSDLGRGLSNLSAVPIVSTK
ncbi:SIR2 family protein [uncultured Nevskia sp.]|uniref:SIR2 family protein n=1 Tax=uncultured Nevskia sp. TaxID=228950 RepID=UPI0025E9DDC9|nr:SIR2 family protein [uncultured Nevskia sp.]